MTNLNPAQPLIDHQPRHSFFIGIDSDGCAFDSMEIKQKECFIPNIIKYFDLQPVSKYARETAEFVNLYSEWRGINRFPAVQMTLDLLRRRREVIGRKAVIPRMEALRAWIAREDAPGNPTLRAAISSCNGEAAKELQKVLEWSLAVNASVEDIVHGVPPFPWVRECLQVASPKADMIVVSATPGDALVREWTEHDLAQFASVIAGQEMGKKSDHLKFAAVGKYPSDNVLMIGDAPGDLKAARDNGVLFYPILPGDEEMSWKRLLNEGLHRFFSGDYRGDYEKSLIDAFLCSLPHTPPWEEVI